MSTKKVCIIAYWFPPLRAAGSVRGNHFANDAVEMGYDVSVITVKPNQFASPDAPSDYNHGNYKVHQTKAFDLNEFLRSLAKKLKGSSRDTAENKQAVSAPGSPSKLKLKIKALFYWFYKHIICFPDQWFFWYFRSRKEIARILSDEKPDIIICSGPPFTSYFFARDYKKKNINVFWVADFRDLWSKNQVYLRPWPLNAIERKWEKCVLRNCDLITTVGEHCTELQTKLHPEKDIATIYNGYDRDINNETCGTDSFKLLYTGVIYEGFNRDPELLFRALSELKKEDKIKGDSFQFHVYGKVPSSFISRMNEMDIADLITVSAAIDRQKVLELQLSVNLLVLIEWSDGALPVKLYEYMATRIPQLILAHENSELAGLADSVGIGVCDSVQEIKGLIMKEYQLWQSTKSNRLLKESYKVGFYARPEQSKRLYSVIEECIKNKK